ncbi:MAG: winged helix-turn-helix domain-containing protein [Clostridium sp.]
MKKQLNVQSSIRLKGDQKAFGPGIASLLEGVARLGSLRKSAADMDMSYSKAWTMIKNCERELGISLLNKKIGGKGGGGADLTGEAESLLKRYRAFEREASIRLDTLAGKYFPEYIKNTENTKFSEAGPWILVRGAGDLATGVILRLYRSGFRVAALSAKTRRPSAAAPPSVRPCGRGNPGGRRKLQAGPNAGTGGENLGSGTDSASD